MNNSDLYKLNKDELVYLISTIREHSIQEGEERTLKNIKKIKYTLALHNLEKYKQQQKFLYPDIQEYIQKITNNAKSVIYDLVYIQNYDNIGIEFVNFDPQNNENGYIDLDEISTTRGVDVFENNIIYYKNFEIIKTIKLDK